MVTEKDFNDLQEQILIRESADKALAELRYLHSIIRKRKAQKNIVDMVVEIENIREEAIYALQKIINRK